MPGRVLRIAMPGRTTTRALDSPCGENDGGLGALDSRGGENDGGWGALCGKSAHR